MAVTPQLDQADGIDLDRDRRQRPDGRHLLDDRFRCGESTVVGDADVRIEGRGVARYGLGSPHVRGRRDHGVPEEVERPVRANAQMDRVRRSGEGADSRGERSHGRTPLGGHGGHRERLRAGDLIGEGDTLQGHVQTLDGSQVESVQVPQPGLAARGELLDRGTVVKPDDPVIRTPTRAPARPLPVVDQPVQLSISIPVRPDVLEFVRTVPGALSRAHRRTLPAVCAAPRAPHRPGHRRPGGRAAPRRLRRRSANPRRTPPWPPPPCRCRWSGQP